LGNWQQGLVSGKPCHFERVDFQNGMQAFKAGANIRLYRGSGTEGRSANFILFDLAIQGGEPDIH
jgi:hypothetical protein